MSLSARHSSVFFACTTLILALVAWHHARARGGAPAPGSSHSERQVLARLQVAEAHAESLARELAALRGDPRSGRSATETATQHASRASLVARPAGDSSSAAPARNPRPPVLQVEQAYSPLIESLELSAEQTRTFQRLLVSKQQTLQDLRAIADREGIDVRTNVDAMRTLVRSTQRETEAQIAALLGSAAYARYQQFQKDLPRREVTERLRQTLSFVGAALTAVELERITETIAHAFDVTPIGI